MGTLVSASCDKIPGNLYIQNFIMKVLTEIKLRVQTVGDIFFVGNIFCFFQTLCILGLFYRPFGRPDNEGHRLMSFYIVISLVVKKNTYASTVVVTKSEPLTDWRVHRVGQLRLADGWARGTLLVMVERSPGVSKIRLPIIHQSTVGGEFLCKLSSQLVIFLQAPHDIDLSVWNLRPGPVG